MTNFSGKLSLFEYDSTTTILYNEESFEKLLKFFESYS